VSEADPYLPGHGDPRYAVEHYDLDLRYKPLGNHLEGRAVLRVRALTELPELLVDLHGLTVTALQVAGAQVARWSHRGSRIRVRLRQPAPAGAQLLVTVAYRGSPRTMRGPDGAAGWEELTDGVLVAAQPHGAPTWFPCNDRMSDKARYRIAVATDPGYRVVANGEPAVERRVGRRVAWVHEQRHPMATYLATLQIGRYAVDRQVGDVPSWLVGPPARMPQLRETFVDQPRMLEVFAGFFGAYPFDRYTVVVADDPLDIPLESQTLSTFGLNHLSRSWEAQRLIAHELSHQWFGNAVTAGSLADIWLHEGFACYAEWLWSEASGRSTADEEARRHHAALARLSQDLVLTDPGPRRTFDDRVYKRGALTLHALRLALGDEPFFGLLRSWVAAHRYGVVTTVGFEEAVHALGGDDHADLLRAWLHEARLPDLPAPRTGPLQRARAAVTRRLPG
jgi:aminopeptidase N